MELALLLARAILLFSRWFLQPGFHDPPHITAAVEHAFDGNFVRAVFIIDYARRAADNPVTQMLMPRRPRRMGAGLRMFPQQRQGLLNALPEQLRCLLAMPHRHPGIQPRQVILGPPADQDFHRARLADRRPRAQISPSTRGVSAR